jgi:hypothetical protein
MTKSQYIELYKSYPKWELNAMKKALTVLGGFFNTEEDNIRLSAIKIALKGKL